MNQIDYHITKVMPDINMQSIIHTEGICPICKSKNTFYVTTTRYRDEIWQNKYNCKDCKTEWMGNSYKQDFTRVTPEEENKYQIHPNPILEGLAYLFST